MFFKKDENKITLALQGKKSVLPELIEKAIDEDEKFAEKQYHIDRLIDNAAKLYELNKVESKVYKDIKLHLRWAAPKEITGFLVKSNKLSEGIIKICKISYAGMSNSIETSNNIGNEIERLNQYGIKNKEISALFEANNRRLQNLENITKLLNIITSHLLTISESTKKAVLCKDKNEYEELLRQIDNQKSNLIEIIKIELELTKEEESILLIDSNLINERFNSKGLLNINKKLKELKNNRVKTKLTKIVAGTLLFAHIAGIGTSTYLFTHHMPIQTNQIVNQDISKKLSEQKQNITKESIVFKSKDGLNLHGDFYKNSKADPSKAIVLIHGWAANRSQMLSFVEKYIADYNVFVYDSRGAGENEFNSTGLGFEERLDLVGALGMLSSKGVKDVVLQGLSMGAATIAFTLGEEKIDNIKISGVVLQGMYANQGATQVHYNETLNHMPPTISKPAGLILKMIKGKNLSEISTLNEIHKINVPILLVYNDKDPQLVSSDNEMLSKEVNKKSNSQVLVIHGSKHVDMSAGTQEGMYKFIKDIF